MNFLKRIFMIGVVLHQSFCFSQKKTEIYQPNIWLYDITKVDTLKSQLNHHQELKLGNKTNWFTKNRLKSSNNLFVVFKSDSDEPFISILGNKHSFFLQPQSFKITVNKDLNGYNQSYGELMDFRLGDMGDNFLLLNNKADGIELYELILDHNLSEYRTNEIRTYLSIKYGVDLIDHKQYVYKDNKQLWTKAKNNSNIFGLARLDFFNLFQTQSIHSKYKEWSVQFSSDADIENLKDGDYVLIGDNNKMSRFIKEVNQKTWSLQNNVATHIDLIWNVEKSDEENFYEYFLVWEGKEIRGESNKNKIQFANISLQPGTHDFELRRRKTNLIIHSQSFCNNFQIEIEKFNSESTFPIAYKIFDDKQQLLMQGDYQTPITLENLKTSSLYIEVEYAHKKYNKQLDFLSEEWKSLEFQSIYWLGSEPLSFYFEKDDFKRVEWYKENKKFADSYNTLLQEEGTYKVILTNQSDCQKEFSFQVRKACASDTWNIYPNPASVNEWISTEFHWQENKKVDIKIYQEDGKLVKSFPPFYTNHLDVPKFQLTTSGVYIIVAYIDNNLEIKKLIIK